jgi:NhaP-type Na+/H+ and K+/H+ antiporter
MMETFVFWVLAVWAGVATAADKHPLSYTIGEYGLVLAAALLGGLVSFYAKVRKGAVRAANLMHLVGELTTSAFAGLLAFWVCEYLDVPQLLMPCVVGIAGHAGAQGISLLEEALARRARIAAGLPPEPPK